MGKAVFKIGSTVALAAMITSCATTADVDGYAGESVTPFASFDTQVPVTRVDGLNRIELAELNANAEIFETLPSAQTVSAPYFETVFDHEKSVSELQNPDEKSISKALNFNVDTYKPQQYTSVQDTLPPGWQQINEGYLHLNSGLVCVYGASTEGDEYTFSLTQIRLFDDQSTDVGCDYEASTGGFITVFASYWPEITQENHFQSADQQIKTQFNTDKAVDVPIIITDGYDVEVMGLPSTSGYEVSPQNSLNKVVSSLRLVKTYDWHVKARVTHASNDGLTMLFGGILFNRAHTEVYNKNSSVPTGGIDV